MSGERKGTPSPPDLDDLNHLIYEIYAHALAVDSSRDDLRTHLLKELTTNREKFEITVTELLKKPTSSTPKKLTVAEKEFVLEHWDPSFWSKGSQLRLALSKAKIVADELHSLVATEEAKHAILNKLESTNLSWSDCDALRVKVEANWSIANDLLYLIAFKQAQMLFEACVLQYKTAYHSAIFSVEEILYLLSREDAADDITTYLENKGLLSKNDADESKSDAEDTDSAKLTIPTLKKDFFDNLGGAGNFPDYKDVAVTFVEICKEWFQVGACVTTISAVLDEKTDARELKVAKLLWEKIGDSLTRRGTSQGMQSSHDIVMTTILTSLQEGNPEIAKVFMQQIAKCKSSQEFLAYKLSQHLKWIVSLYLHPSKELRDVDIVAIKKFLVDHPSPLYVLPGKPNELLQLMQQIRHHPPKP